MNPTGEHGPTQRDVSGALFCGWCGVDLDDLDGPATPSGTEPTRCHIYGCLLPDAHGGECSSYVVTRTFPPRPEASRALGDYETCAVCGGSEELFLAAIVATARREIARVLDELRGEAERVGVYHVWEDDERHGPLVERALVLALIDRIKHREANDG